MVDAFMKLMLSVQDPPELRQKCSGENFILACRHMSLNNRFNEMAGFQTPGFNCFDCEG